MKQFFKQLLKRLKVGNKIDQEEHREVGRHEAERYAEQNNCTYFETSAKDSTGINDAFESGIFHICCFESISENLTPTVRALLRICCILGVPC